MITKTTSVPSIFLISADPDLPLQPASTTSKQHAHPAWPLPPNMSDTRLQSVLSWLSTVPAASVPMFQTATADATAAVFSLCPTVGGFVFASEFPAASSSQPPRKTVDPKKHRGKKTDGHFSPNTSLKAGLDTAANTQTLPADSLGSASNTSMPPFEAFSQPSRSTLPHSQPPATACRPPSQKAASSNPYSNTAPVTSTTCCPPQHLCFQHPNSSTLVSLCLLDPVPELQLLQKYLSSQSADIPLSTIFQPRTPPSSSVQDPEPSQPIPSLDHNQQAPSLCPEPPCRSSLPPSHSTASMQLCRSLHKRKFMIPFFMLTLLLCIPLGEAMRPLYDASQI